MLWLKFTFAEIPIESFLKIHIGCDNWKNVYSRVKEGNVSDHFDQAIIQIEVDAIGRSEQNLHISR